MERRHHHLNLAKYIASRVDKALQALLVYAHKKLASFHKDSQRERERNGEREEETERERKREALNRCRQ